MKKVLRTTGIMGLALASPLFAIERPTPADSPKETGEFIEAPAVENADAPKEGNNNAAKMAWLGVAGSPVDEVLSYHLGVEAGDGILLELVAPGSPAAAAGLKPHDVLTKVGGKKIQTMNDLRDLMKARKPGDEVKVEVYTRGKMKEHRFKLTGRPADLPVIPEVENKFEARLPRLMLKPGELPLNLFQGMDDRERDMIEKLLRGRLENLQKDFGFDEFKKDGARIDRMKLNLGNLMGGDKFTGKSSVTMRDGDGTRFRMEETDGGRELEVKDKEGNLLFSGPYNTEGDKEAVPDDLREKIRRFGLENTQKNRLPLKIRPRR